MFKLLLLSLVAMLTVAAVGGRDDPHRLQKMEETWITWKKNHGKVYSPVEEKYRRSIFFQNLDTIEKHNAKYPVEVSYTKGLNQFSDRTIEEYRSYNKLKIRGPAGRNCNSTFLPPLNYQLPASVDWRKHGYVTEIKDQSLCGSCWAFSTTGSVEGQHFRSTGKLLSLSEQQLLDCNTKNSGCLGGYMDWAMHYIMAQPGGLETEYNYPYDGLQMQCRVNVQEEVAAITGCVDVPSGSELSLQQAVASVGPISVAVDASKPSFALYQSGVYVEPECSTTQLDHGVLVVGYGTDKSGHDYWIIKNSWGTWWGINGYMLMARNKHNMCGIATTASYPTVKPSKRR